LNDDFADDVGSGATVFIPDRNARAQAAHYGLPQPPKEVVVMPRAGSALVFFQTGVFSPRHEGRQHHQEGDFKYILRSDVAYSAKPQEGADQEQLPLQSAEDALLVGTESWMREVGGRVLGGDAGFTMYSTL
jgi:hypothetical protein